MVEIEKSRSSELGHCDWNEKKGVFSVRIIKTTPESFERIFGYLTTFIEIKERAMPGFTEARVLGSDDKSRIIVIVEWKQLDSWVRSEWDADIGVVLEELLSDAQAVDFRLYFGDRFAPLTP